VLCKNIDIHKLAPRKSQYLITTEDRGQSVMLKCALNVRDLALALQLCQGNKQKTAEKLGITKSSLYRRLEKYGLEV